MADIFVASRDGLKGLFQAVNAVFPQTLTQLCVVHIVRASLRYVSSKDAKLVGAALKRVYRSAAAEEGERELNAFEVACGETDKAVVRMWRNNWGTITPFFQFLPEIHKVR